MTTIVLMARRRSHISREQVASAFGHALVQLRDETGITQEKLAADAGVDRTTISMYERGIKCPSLVVVVRLAEALECDPSHLMERFLSQIRRR